MKWFNPKKHTGWKKHQSATTRRRHLLDSTDKRKSLHDRRLEAARRALALANVTKDPATKKKAMADANHFFKLARGKNV